MARVTPELRVHGDSSGPGLARVTLVRFRGYARAIARSPHPLAWFAALGSLGCAPPAVIVTPPEPGDSAGDVPGDEPSGREGPSPNAKVEASAKVPESREWCGAIIDTRPRPLLRTSSFLLAWNEIRLASGRVQPGPIPLTEPDARLAICGGPTCVPLLPQAIEFNEAGQISIGTVIADGHDGLLTIPDLSPFVGPTQCSGRTQLHAEPVGALVQIVAEVREQERMYMHHGYYGHYGGCYAIEGRHDVFIDLETQTIVLEIEHRAGILEVAATHDGGLHVTLTGCSDKLELAWTE